MGELSMRESYGRALADYAALNPKVVAVDVDTSMSTLTHFFAAKYPERFFNVGIAEPCAVDVGAGLALGGYIPFVNAFAALLALRSLEQIRTCVCYTRTNVKIAASYAGISDFKDGPTHFAVTDIANVRALPNMTVIVPADANEAAQFVPLVAEYEGPVYLRISRGNTLPVHTLGAPLQIGKGILRREGGDVTLVATGSMVGRSLQAAELLAAQGVNARVVEIHTIKPLDVDLLVESAKLTGALVTVEEHAKIGGLGSAVAEALAEIHPVPMQRVGLADEFCVTGRTVEGLLDHSGLAVADIVSAVQQVLKRK
ncbi:MAG: transketolase [Chloroflexi bacterium HGW-Chloroflexi-4]|jgi:transketolase|nr:MAG: transketolase [Chloroflexi bacterium HGW-Chloroflexi-4]